MDCGGGLRCDTGAYEASCVVEPTVYESSNPDMSDAAAVGTTAVSPYEHIPGEEQELYYQVDDGAGFPEVIWLVKGDPALFIHF